MTTAKDGKKYNTIWEYKEAMISEAVTEKRNAAMVSIFWIQKYSLENIVV